MPDAALSVSSSPLAAMLPGGTTDSAPKQSNAAKSGDPFAALLASANAPKTPGAAAATGTADAVAALLASAAPVVTTPVAPMAVPTAAPTLPISPIAAEALPAEPAAPISLPRVKAKSGDDAESDTDKDDKDDSEDPLGDAIASGATAVLALAPTIVAPVPPQVQHVTPEPKPARIDTSIAPKALKPMPLPMPVKTASASPAPSAHAPADPIALASQSDSGAAQADANARQQPQEPSPAPTDAKPAAVQLPPEVAKAVVAALKQGDANPATTPQAEMPVAADVTKAALAQQPVQQPAQPVIRQAVQQEAVQTTPAPRRRSDETAPAPRRASDARRRADSFPTDVASAGLTQRAADTQPATSRPVTDVQAKGDTMVEQTLTIARDGAWLDKLAKDIAGAGSGGDLQFKLSPQNLGALSVSISQKDEGASIRLTADNQQTRDILVDAQPKLIAEARAQGLKVSDTQVDVRQDQNNSQNQGNSQDSQRWAQNQAGQQNASQQGQNRQSSPEHKPFVSNLARKAEVESESASRDSDALYA